MEKVISVLDEREKLNTTKIIEMTELSPKSVCNTLKLFLEKNIVTLHTFKDRKNNEKIYSLNRINATLYIHHFHWNRFPKTIRNAQLQSEKISLELRGKKYAYATLEFPEKFVTQEIRNKKIKIPQKYVSVIGRLGEYTPLVNLPIDVFEVIVMNFHMGKYCKLCWENDELIELKICDDIRYCNIHGLNEINQYSDESPLKNEINLWSYKKHKYYNDEKLLKNLKKFNYEK